MTKRQLLLSEIEQIPEPLLDEILGFVDLLKSTPRREGLETALASEAVLAREWLQPEEDDAWRDL